MPPQPTRPVLADSTRLTDHIRRHLVRYTAGLGLLGTYQFAQYWFDTRLMRAIDEAIAGHSALAIRYGLSLALVALAAFSVRVLSRVVIFNAGRIAEYELRNALLARLHRLGPSFYRHMSPGDIMSRATNDLTQVRLLLGFGALNLINTAFALVSAFSVTLTISVRLTLASLATFPALLVVTRGFGRRLYGTTRANQQALGEMSAAVQSSIAGIRVVRAFALEESEISRFERTNRDYLDKSLSLARLRGSMGPAMQAISAVGMLVVFWYGGYLLLAGEMRPGGFLAFYRALARLTWPLMALGFLVGMVQRGRASYSRLKEIYDAAADVSDGSASPSSDSSVPRLLEVKSLSYAFNGRPVLSDVSFTLRQGESLAIVGRTGSGKSTLARVLARLEPTPRGTVFLDGRDICDLPVSALRSAIGLSQQDAFLFSTTAARNIGYTLDDPESTRARQLIAQAARDAQVFDELMTLPDGLDTVVGERGVQMSGGQKQRVALGRAFVYRPPFLVLDDPLSAVDARTERAILEAIDRQRAERSLILITHRVAAAAHCDRVLVLDRGQIVQQGTPEQLARASGLYRRFAAEQRLASELEGPSGLVEESA